MCNAWNHTDDCECGFGPPYGFSGVANILGETKWMDMAVWNEAEFARGIQEVIHDRSIAQKIRANYKRQGFPLPNMHERRWEKLKPERRQEIYLKLKAALGVVRIRKGVSSTHIVRIPLFTLNSPSVSGSQVTYHEAETNNNYSWIVTIAFPGIGMATWKTIKVTYSCDVICADGGCKVIFMPLHIKITPLEVFDIDGKLINRSSQVEAANDNDNLRFSRTVVSGRDECQGKVSSLIDVFDLLWDRSRQPSVRTISLKSDRKHEITVGVDLPSLKANLKTIVEFESILEIRSQLPPGHRYHMYRLSKVHGIAWRVRSSTL